MNHLQDCRTIFEDWLKLFAKNISKRLLQEGRSSTIDHFLDAMSPGSGMMDA